MLLNSKQDTLGKRIPNQVVSCGSRCLPPAYETDYFGGTNHYCEYIFKASAIFFDVAWRNISHTAFHCRNVENALREHHQPGRGIRHKQPQPPLLNMPPSSKPRLMQDQE